MSNGFLNAPLNLSEKRIWVAGHNGLVGRSVSDALERESAEVLKISKNDLDLRHQDDVEVWMEKNRPDMIVLAAAKVGGIQANSSYPAEFIYDNLMIESNIIHAAHKYDVEKLLFLGTSCIYPKYAEQPIKEDALLSAPLEPSNQWYAIAKIAGIKMCQAYRRQYGCDFISAMPCNLYGPGDIYDEERSHVIPAMILKMHHAKQNKIPELVFWGTGTPFREFLYIDDLSSGLVHLLKIYSEEEHINVGSGEEVSIHDLAVYIAEIIGYEGRIEFDPTKADGTPRKVLDTSKIFESGWRPETSLKEGLIKAYKDYCERTV